MDNYGAIDIGTNSTRLLLAAKTGEILKPLRMEIEVTRLGQGVDKNRILQTEAMERTIEALKKFKSLTQEAQVVNLQLIATSAVRDAGNKQEFLEKVFQATGLRVEIIPGAEEARLTYWGAVADLQWPPGNIVVFDLGGGSTEFIVGDQQGIKLLTSIDVGAVRMTEAYLHSNPVLEAEYLAMKEHIRTQLTQILNRIREYEPKLLLGVGGTATSLAAMDQELNPYDPSKVHGYSIASQRVSRLTKKLKELKVEERAAQLPGLHPKRADVILGGAVVVETILEILNLNSLQVSENDILLGTIYRLFRD